MYKQSTVIDVHGHMSSPPQFRAYAYRLICSRSTDGRLQLKAPALRGAVEHHLELLDARGIDAQFISPRPVAMMQWERPALVANWTSTTNDVIAEQCSIQPRRLLGVAQLPQSPELSTANCVEELRRCVEELGFVGALVNPDPGSDGRSPGVHDEYWFPLYEAAASLGATLMIHPSFGRDPRLDIIPHSFQYNFLVHETLATLLYEHSDVFERFPDLKIVVCHCGGAPNRLLRLSASGGAERSGDAPGGSVGMPVEREETVVPDRSANLFFDTCAYDTFYLETAIRQRGVSQMVFGSEVPGAGTAFINPVTGRPADDLVGVIGDFGFLSEAEKTDILTNNVDRVFPLFAKVDHTALGKEG
jgi:predicted TIM-barrel fold metal-dependent hydrolase